MYSLLRGTAILLDIFASTTAKLCDTPGFWLEMIAASELRAHAGCHLHLFAIRIFLGACQFHVASGLRRDARIFDLKRFRTNHIMLLR